MTRAEFESETLYREYVEFLVRLILLRISTETRWKP